MNRPQLRPPAGRVQAARRLSLAVLGLATMALAVLALGLGAVELSPAEVLGALARAAAGQPPESGVERIVVSIRLPRVLLAALVGSSLAGAGAAFQGLFRNPMADPYVLGVSGGASLGASLAVLLDLKLNLFGFGAVPVLAFTGALGAVHLVHGLARTNGRLPTSSLLLAGIAVAALFAALVSMLVYLSGERLRPIVFWLLGSLSGASWPDVAVVAVYHALGLLALAGSARSLNALLLGEEAAHYAGVDVERVKARLLTAGAVMTAAAVSVSGVIGFVGLIVPHAVRFVIGADHRYLLPAASLAGAAFLVACDTLARTLLAPVELPVGILTAMAGAPFFLHLLRRHGRRLGGP